MWISLNRVFLNCACQQISLLLQIESDLNLKLSTFPFFHSQCPTATRVSRLRFCYNKQCMLSLVLPGDKTAHLNNKLKLLFKVTGVLRNSPLRTRGR